MMFVVETNSLTLHNPFYNKLVAHAGNMTADDPMVINIHSIANMNRAMYNRQLLGDICRILVHHMQHTNEALSAKKMREKEIQTEGLIARGKIQFFRLAVR